MGLNNRKDDIHDEDEDGVDLEGQGQGTVVIVERDGGQGGQYCAHYYQHPSLRRVFQGVRVGKLTWDMVA